MTHPLEQRRRLVPRDQRRTIHAEMRLLALDVRRELAALKWPTDRWRRDPVGFAREALGIELWAKQVEIAESVRDNPLTSVKSGHRIGKSTVAAALALWFYATFFEARVVVTAPTSRQVEGILWRELRKLFERAKLKLDGELSVKPATGLVSPNFREVKGYTAKDVEAITGTAGANLFFILDEASGIADAIYEGLEGNRAGWSEDPLIMVRLLLIGNPTKTSGEFYDSFEHPKKKQVYNRITVSSRDTPNAREGRIVHPGLATREWIAQMEAKYGTDSSFVKVRIDGEFPIGEDGKAFSIDLITRSQERWDETEGVGELRIGIDPAGDSGTGDDAAFSAVRGLKQIALRTYLGLSPDDHWEKLEGLVDELAPDRRERVVCVLDVEGPVGAKVHRALARRAHRRDSRITLRPVRASARPTGRDAKHFGRVRDQLAAQLAQWVRDGGALLEDEQLEAELHVLEWDMRNGQQKITPKEHIRKELGRSPDRFDATALSTWPHESAADTQRELDEDLDDADELDDAADPYAGRLDPYAR
jgi:phage terminase large subunit